MRPALFSTHTRSFFSRCSHRALSGSAARLAGYTYSNVFGETSTPTTIDSVTLDGFAMRAGILIPTPVILLNEHIFLWNVPPLAPNDLSWRGFTLDSFKIFEVVTPKPEMIVIGTGRSVVPLAPRLRDYLRNLGYQLEIQDSGRAAASLNMLVEEGRSVAGALLPLRPVNAKTGKPAMPVPAT